MQSVTIVQRAANATGVASPWIFSRRVDLAVFLAPALVSFALLALGAHLGLLHDASPDATPEWTWVGGVLLVDVAHVWATSFRTYLDPIELRRRPLLYVGTPIAAFAFASIAYRIGEPFFWRALAYVAIAHFVRQQWGWVAMYRSRARSDDHDRDRRGRLVDFATIHLASLAPLAWWHAHLPRTFAWFVQGDLIALPPIVATAISDLALALFVASLVAYVACAIRRVRVERAWDVGKHLVVASTIATWWVGIVVFDSDYAFTVTNVFVHGVPYFALVFFWGRGALGGARKPSRVHPLVAMGPIAFGASLWAIAYVEELLWDRALWGERPWLFGASWSLSAAARAVVVPLLAVPQITHYVLDGVVWRRAELQGGPSDAQCDGQRSGRHSEHGPGVRNRRARTRRRAPLTRRSSKSTSSLRASSDDRLEAIANGSAKLVDARDVARKVRESKK